MAMPKSTWTSVRSADQWNQSQRDYVYTVIGRKTVDTITSADVMAVFSK